MKPITIDYKMGEEGDEAIMGQVTMSFPEDLNEMKQVWGEALAYNKAKAQIVIDARKLCYGAESPEKAQEAIDSYVPGVSRARGIGGFSKKALTEALGQLDETEIQKIMTLARERAAQKKEE